MGQDLRSFLLGGLNRMEENRDINQQLQFYNYQRQMQLKDLIDKAVIENYIKQQDPYRQMQMDLMNRYFGGVSPQGQPQVSPQGQPRGMPSLGTIPSQLSQDEFITKPSLTFGAEGPSVSFSQVENPALKWQREKLNIATGLRKEFDSSKAFKDYQTIKRSASGLQAAYNKSITSPNRIASDQAMAVLLQKMLDPESVVRESEYARTPEGAAFVNRLSSFIPKLQKGGLALTDSDRYAIFEMSQLLLQEGQKDFNSNIDRFTELSGLYEIDPRLIFGNIRRTEVKPLPNPYSQQNILQQFPQQGQEGTIKQYSPLQFGIGRLKRYGALATQGAIGDVPFLRNVLPEQVRQVKPFYPSEQLVSPLARLGRDIGLVSGLQRGAQAIPFINRLGALSKLGKMPLVNVTPQQTANIQRVSKMADIGGKLATAGITGAGYGALTAGSEEPEDIVKSTALGSVIFPAFEGTAIATQPLRQQLWNKAIQPSIANIFEFTANIPKEATEYALKRGSLNILTRQNWSKEIGGNIAERMKIGSKATLSILQNKWRQTVNPIRKNLKNTIPWDDVLNQADNVFRDFGIIDDFGRIRKSPLKKDTTFEKIIGLRNDLRAYKVKNLSVDEAMRIRESIDRIINTGYKDNIFTSKDMANLKQIRGIINEKIHSKYTKIADIDSAYSELYDAFDIIDIDWNDPKKVAQLANTIDKFPNLQPVIQSAFKNVENEIKKYGGKGFIEDIYKSTFAKQFQPTTLRSIRTGLIASILGIGGGVAGGIMGGPGGAALGTVLGVSTSTPRLVGGYLKTGTRMMKGGKLLGKKVLPPTILRKVNE